MINWYNISSRAAELGDYDPEVHVGNYAADYELVSRQSAQLEEKAIELHQKLKGLTPSEADILFLKKSATLDTYGVDPHPVKVRDHYPTSRNFFKCALSSFKYFHLIITCVACFFPHS